MKKIIVLGAGMIGSAIAYDLSSQFDITAADIDQIKLNSVSRRYSVKTINADISDGNNLKKIIKNFNFVVSAVPGFMGFKVLKNIIEAGKDAVDISFFSEDPFQLDKLAKEKKVTAVVDCGVAPGLSNIILGYQNSKMKINSFECLVGGLPLERVLPFQYKAPFSLVDVIEEYTRPARIVEGNKLIIKPALSEIEQVDIKEIGTLESFNTDGLRTLIQTMKIPDMKEKTLRYPGHIEYIKFLKESGFFNKEEIEINGIRVKPVDFTSKLLFPIWHLEENEKEFTILKIKITGNERGKIRNYSYFLLDKFDEKTGISSMARTTGFTCSAVARLLINDLFKRKGVCPPEYIGANESCFKKVINDLDKRGINFKIEKN